MTEGPGAGGVGAVDAGDESGPGESRPSQEPGHDPGHQASHDPGLTERLTEFMTQGWAPADDPSLLAVDPVAPYAASRRASLSTRFPADVLVIPTGTAKIRSNDTDYPFRAGSDYAWLVGDLEPDGVLVLWPESGYSHHSVVYVPARSDRTSTAFFTDRRYGELWVGPRRGPDEVARVFGIDSVPLDQLAEALSGLDPAAVRTVRGLDPLVDAAIPVLPAAAPQSPGPGSAASEPAEAADYSEPTDQAGGDSPRLTRDQELDQALAELRMIKDDWEIGQLEGAIAATVRGFADVVHELPAARTVERGERWLEGTFWRRSRLEGNDVGYGSIVACGHHATTLHWTRDDGPVADGELLLLDMGVEARSLYTADVTRTLPVSGRFTGHQRMVYDAVHEAQRAAIDVVAPGAAFADVHRAAMLVLTRHLVDWGLLDGDVEVLAKETMHRRWTLHGTSHHLGIDVHDCSLAREERYRRGRLETGMVITVEPGLYFQRNDELAPAHLRGIGVRIEDDVLVTHDGARVLSAALPTGASEVEAWMQSLPPR